MPPIKAPLNVSHDSAEDQKDQKYVITTELLGQTYFIHLTNSSWKISIAQHNSKKPRMKNTTNTD